MSDEEGYKYTKTDVAATIVAIIMLGFGYIISIVIQNSMPDLPDGWGPPPIILWMPLIMCSIPLIICILCWVMPKNKKGGPEIHRYRDETMVYTGDYSLDVKPSDEEEKTVYLIPAECPSCGLSLSEENVDWVGPLQAKCPNCETIVEAKEKNF